MRWRKGRLVLGLPGPGGHGDDQPRGEAAYDLGGQVHNVDITKSPRYALI